MENETEGQTTIDAKGDGVRLGNKRWKSFELEGQSLWRVLTTVAALANQYRVTGMGCSGGDILREAVAAFQSGDVAGQLPEFPPGQELLVGVVLFEDSQPL